VVTRLRFKFGTHARSYRQTSRAEAWRGYHGHVSHACHSALALALLASCASSPAGEYALYLHSDGYGCGAEEGLGCGLELDPVLERLDAIDGVASSEVTWDGRLFRLRLEPGVNRERVEAEAMRLLGSGGDTGDAPAPADQDLRWYDAEETLQLSLHEAGVIAKGWIAGIQSEFELSHASAERLEALLRDELRLAFTKAHDVGGGLHRLREQAPAARARLEPKLAEFLSVEQQAAVALYLDGVLSQ
jgi:hypothetical protein